MHTCFFRTTPITFEFLIFINISSHTTHPPPSTFPPFLPLLLLLLTPHPRPHRREMRSTTWCASTRRTWRPRSSRRAPRFSVQWTEAPRGSRCSRRRGARTSRWTRRLRTSGEREECECASRILLLLAYVLRVTRLCPASLSSVRQSASFGSETKFRTQESVGSF